MSLEVILLLLYFTRTVVFYFTLILWAFYSQILGHSSSIGYVFVSCRRPEVKFDRLVTLMSTGQPLHCLLTYSNICTLSIINS